MMFSRFGTTAVLLLTAAACSRNVGKTIIIKNDHAFKREEVVSIPLAKIADFDSTQRWIVKSDDGMIVATQLWDSNSDSVADEIIFSANIPANTEKKFQLLQSDEVATGSGKTFARFVPERTDDYAWENDRVAFRTYGPEAQRMVEEGVKGGTLSSGMDCWLKRVEYPIIDKWYKKYVDGGSYHKDDGEGYDPYHVGASRGCGGIGVWINDSLYVSRNFIKYRTIANGPVRTCFELTYAPWTAGMATIEETKRITIDRGSQLCKIEVSMKSSETLPNCTIGITLHNKQGVVSLDSAQGVFSYWEPMDDSEIGTGVVIAPRSIVSAKDFRSTNADRSHIFIHAKSTESVTYFAGFGWKKAGLVSTAAEWNNYLQDFAKQQASSLTIQVQ
jgi:hypothetical protein